MSQLKEEYRNRLQLSIDDVNKFEKTPESTYCIYFLASLFIVTGSAVSLSSMHKMLSDLTQTRMLYSGIPLIAFGLIVIAAASCFCSTPKIDDPDLYKRFLAAQTLQELTEKLKAMGGLSPSDQENPDYITLSIQSQLEKHELYCNQLVEKIKANDNSHSLTLSVPVKNL